jgi:transcriptional regulator with XRE-family HTH domain
MNDAPITPEQVRAARRLLGWSRIRLASRVGVGEVSIAVLERGVRLPQKLDLNRARAALESAGVIFVEENGEGPGVRLRKAAK